VLPLLLLLQWLVGVVAHEATSGRDSDEGGPQCLVHNSRHHSAEECWEIKKLTEQFHEQQKQQARRNGTSPHQREGKQQVAHEGNEEHEMEFQNAKGAIKVVYSHSNSDSEYSDNE
jgi:hypothetical protein